MVHTFVDIAIGAAEALSRASPAGAMDIGAWAITTRATSFANAAVDSFMSYYEQW